VRDYLSTDRLRLFRLHEAPDAKSMRVVQREVELLPDRVGGAAAFADLMVHIAARRGLHWRAAKQRLRSFVVRPLLFNFQITPRDCPRRHSIAV